MKLFWIMILLFFIHACSSYEAFENTSKTCKLKLYKDSTYVLNYVTILTKCRRDTIKVHEIGAFKIRDNSIILKHIVSNYFSSVVEHLAYDKKSPDSVEFSFENINDSSITVGFSLNKDSTIYTTVDSGKLKLSYSDLHSNKIISNYVFESFRIYYNNKEYIITDENIKAPTSISFELNQYDNQRRVPLYRGFDFNGDTIIFDIDSKVIGSDNKMYRVRK